MTESARDETTGLGTKTRYQKSGKLKSQKLKSRIPKYRITKINILEIFIFEILNGLKSYGLLLFDRQILHF